MRKLAIVAGALFLGLTSQAHAIVYIPVSLENLNANSDGFALLQDWSADNVDITGPAFALTNPTFRVEVFIGPNLFIDSTVVADAWNFNLTDPNGTWPTPTNHVCTDNPAAFLEVCPVDPMETPGFSQSGEGFFGTVTGGPGAPTVVITWCNEEGCFDEMAMEGSTYRLTLEQIPVPAAVWLFGSALGLLGWVRRRA
ncbi:MAG: VPLPA-CTERM sorting domain-containing protein [Gammaproteobacteria bacterium]|nr:VPLPA-CTERM sorting domain-containing protein [Gammaproteobacteria bacterium]